jgi:hypothetical protein
MNVSATNLLMERQWSFARSFVMNFRRSVESGGNASSRRLWCFACNLVAIAVSRCTFSCSSLSNEMMSNPYLRPCVSTESSDGLDDNSFGSNFIGHAFAHYIETQFSTRESRTTFHNPVATSCGPQLASPKRARYFSISYHISAAGVTASPNAG